MPYSMTGFAEHKFQIGDWEAETQIKSLNNKFLDIKIKIPESLNYAESDINELIKEKIKRGFVFCQINIKNINQSEAQLKYYETLFLKYYSFIQNIQNKYNIKDSNILTAVLKEINIKRRIFIDEEPEEIFSEEDYKLFLEKISELIDSIMKVKKTEGDNTSDNILNALNEIDTQIEVVETHLPENREYYKNRLLEILNELKITIDTETKKRLETEIVFLLNKTDITEEINRLKSHIEQGRAILQKERSVGKKLNFLVQEILREANTICAKTEIIDIKKAGLNIKYQTEVIREDIQNLE